MPRSPAISPSPQSRELSTATQFKQVPFVRPKGKQVKSITPSYEGWWQNADGTYNLLFGYFSRNSN